MANSGVFRINGGNNKITETDIFFQIAGITDQTHIIAINTLVHLLKLNNLWDKFTAIYPFVGGNDNSHKYNLKNIEKYIISWGEPEGYYGSSALHDSYGVKPRNSRNYLNLNSGDIPNYGTSFSCVMYIRNHHVGDTVDIGQNATISSRLSIHVTHSDGKIYYDFGDSNLGRLSGTIASATGCISFCTLSGVSTIYRNGINTNITKSVPSISLNVPLYFNAGDYNGYVFTNPRQYAFLGLGNGFTSTENKILNDIIQVFQGILNRVV